MNTLTALARLFYLTAHMRELGVRIEWRSRQDVKQVRTMRSEVFLCGLRFAAGVVLAGLPVLVLSLDIVTLCAVQPDAAEHLASLCVTAGEMIAR